MAPLSFTAFCITNPLGIDAFNYPLRFLPCRRF